MDYYQPDIGERPLVKKLNLDAVSWDAGILVRATNWLGDVMMTLPAIYRLRQRLPAGAPLIVVTPKKLASLWDSIPWVDQVITFPHRRFDAACITTLKRQKPGVSVILPNSFGSAWDAWRAHLPHRIGRSGRGRHLLLHHHLPAWRRVAGRDQYHQAREYLQIPLAMGGDSWGCDYPPLCPLPLEKLDSALAEDLSKLPGKRLVIAPGAAYGPAKQWPPDSFNQVARWWTAQQGHVLAIGAPGEETAAQQTITDCTAARNLAGKTSLAGLLSVLSSATCVLANDSGTMHLAAALNRDGVALFGSTDPLATGPLGGRWIIHRQKIPCSPCLRRRCPNTENGTGRCLTDIEPTAVIDSLSHLLTSSESGRI